MSAPVRAISPVSTKQRSSEDGNVGDHIHHGSNESVSSKASKASKGSAVAPEGDEVSKDAIWEQMFEELKAIKEKTGTCNLPDKKGRLAKWVYAQRKAFRRLQFSRGTPSTRARLEKLESIGFEFASSSYVSWDIMFEKYKNRDKVDLGDDEARKLKLWMSNQRLEYSRLRRGLPNNITQERIAKLEAAGFQWVGRTGKPSSSTTAMGRNSSEHSKEEERGAESSDDGEARKAQRQRRLVYSPSPNAKRSHNLARVIVEDGSMNSSNTDAERYNSYTDRKHSRARSSERSHPKRRKPRTAFVLPSRKHGASSATRGDYYIAPESLKKRLRRMDFHEEDGSEEGDDDYCYIVSASRKKRGRVAIYEKDYYDDGESQSDSEESESSCSLCEKAALKAKYRNRDKKRMATEDRDNSNAAFLKMGEKEVAHQKSTARHGKDRTSLGVSSEKDVMDRRYSNSNMAFELPPSPFVASAVTNSSKNDNQGNVEWPSTASLNSARRSSMSSVSGNGVPAAFSPTAPSASSNLPHGLRNNSNALLQMPSTTISSAASGGGMFVTTYVPPNAVALHQRLRQHQSLVRPPQASSNRLMSNFLDSGGMHVDLSNSVHNALVNRYPSLATLPRGEIAQDPNLTDFFHPSMAHFLHPR